MACLFACASHKFLRQQPGVSDNLDVSNVVKGAALALRDAANDKNADKAKLQKLMDKLDKSSDSFDNFNQVECGKR